LSSRSGADLSVGWKKRENGMDLRNIKICKAVTAIAFISLVLNSYILLEGSQNDFLNLTQNIFCIFHILAFSSFKPFSNIGGFYTGEKRYLTLRRSVSYCLWCFTLIAVVSYRSGKLELYPILATLNLALAFTIINAFGFGKTRGSISLCKYL
jgi:hypothetical protein